MGSGLAHGMLCSMERAMVARSSPVSGTQLFILGLPRSGTTLVYQYIVHRLQVAYLTNGVGRFPHAPCLTTWFQTRTHRRYRSDFTSRFGKVSGAMAPREAGGFWGRYFHPDRYLEPGDLSPELVEELRRVVACLQRIHGGRPFVNKNVKHMQRLGLLADTFPGARFLVVSRPLADVALSLLRVRYRVQDDPSLWWSVRPPERYESLRTLPPAGQVAGQVLALDARLERDLDHLASERVIRLDFPRFCQSPDSVVSLLTAALGPLEPANPPVAGFEVQRHRPLNAEEEQLVSMVNNG